MKITLLKNMYVYALDILTCSSVICLCIAEMIVVRSFVSCDCCLVTIDLSTISLLCNHNINHELVQVEY